MLVNVNVNQLQNANLLELQLWSKSVHKDTYWIFDGEVSKNLNTLKVLVSISNKDTANFSVRTNNNDNCIKDFTSDLPEKLIIKYNQWSM